MKRHTVIVLVTALVVLVGATGAVTAQEGNGPPNDLPDQVPDFVTDVLGAIGDFVTGAVSSLGELVSGLTPGDAAPPEGAGPDR